MISSQTNLFRSILSVWVGVLDIVEVLARGARWFVRKLSGKGVGDVIEKRERSAGHRGTV